MAERSRGEVREYLQELERFTPACVCGARGPEDSTHEEARAWFTAHRHAVHGERYDAAKAQRSLERARRTTPSPHGVPTAHLTNDRRRDQVGADELAERETLRHRPVA